MAYLDFQEAHSACPRVDTGTRRSVAAPAGLSPAERTVLRLSCRDPRSSLGEPDRLDTRLLHLLGPRRSNPLADPRLEALRRFGVLLRLEEGRLPEGEDARLRIAGFTADQVAEARGLIWQQTGSARHRRRGSAIAAALLITILSAQLLVCRWLTAYLEDGLLGLLGTLLASALAVAPLRRVSALLTGPAGRAWSR